MFRLIHQDKNTKARIGKLTTPHGEVDTPVFMPVATQATIKTLSRNELLESDVEILLSNAYHLYLRPGVELIRKAGGLHKFMSWEGPILTDSGGYQIFSLASLMKVEKDGVEFQSHVDGSKHFLSPEDVIGIQMSFGSDIMMPLDECVHYPASRDYAEQSVKITNDWARRSKKYYTNHQLPVNSHQLLFGIAQGSTFLDLRKRVAQELVSMGFDGYAIGGVSVGEPQDLIYEIVEFTESLLPQEAPRYLMGVGTPCDMLKTISLGIDMFDCVVPTRNGRNGQAFTWNGELQLRNSIYKDDFRPIDEKCECFSCRTHTRGYIRHLFNTDELLGLRLVSLHNIHFYVKLIQTSRRAIEEDRFLDFMKEFERNYNKEGR